MQERIREEASWQPMKGDFVRFKIPPAAALAQIGIFAHTSPTSIPLANSIWKVTDVKASEGIVLSVMPLKVVRRKQYVAGELLRGTVIEHDPLLTRHLDKVYFPKDMFEPAEQARKEYDIVDHP